MVHFPRHPIDIFLGDTSKIKSFWEDTTYSADSVFSVPLSHGCLALAKYTSAPVSFSIIEEYRGFPSVFLPKCLLLEPDEFNAKLMDWLIWYNTKRVHFAFGNKMTPVQFLLSWKPSEKLAVELPAECKSGWTHTIYCTFKFFC
ncbi:MAG TPA: hypothetical protein VJI73_01105 [Candidatus Paceibacterota bacterium]